MVNAPEESLIQWSENGSTVMVLDEKQFAQTVLPKYFKHNNMDSFVRQMNIYGFKKVQNITDGAMMPPEYMQIEYENPFFVRGRFDLTKNIVRCSQKRKNKNTVQHFWIRSYYFRLHPMGRNSEQKWRVG